MNRRQACQILGASALFPTLARAEKEAAFAPRYVLSSALFGDLPLASVLPQVASARCEAVDIWRRPHATHREQIEEMGDEAFQALLAETGTTMAISTCYPLGPYGQEEEQQWLVKNGGRMTVCAAGRLGDPDVSGAEAKRQVTEFFENLKPHYERAEELGITMAIENHKNSLLSSPDSIRYFVDLNPSKHVGIAFAPHHLFDVVDEIPGLIEHCGKENLPFIYFQEYHISSKQEMSVEEELKQLPGFGTLDYVPILAALKKVDFDGVVEIFMHPTPRGTPMLETPEAITEALQTSLAYLDGCLEEISDGA